MIQSRLESVVANNYDAIMGIYGESVTAANIARENNQIKMVLSELGVRNGEAYIDSVDYQDITTEQKSAILTLLEKYTYRRIFDTLFLSWGMDQLEEKERQLIYMRYFEDMTQSQVAKKMNMSQVSVSRLEKKILKSLRQRLE